MSQDIDTMFSKEEIDFIQQHLHTDTSALFLKYGKDKESLIKQIEARQKSRTKLPEWYANPDVIFPPALSVEQSSSETTARYKASLISDGTLIDATGGMGIDSYFFSKQCEAVIYIEQNETLVARAHYNFAVLKATNIRCVHQNSIDFLEKFPQKVDCIYLDPARRSADQKRVVSLPDCEPDVTKHLALLLKKARHILLKASPLLDLKQTIQTLPFIHTVHVVAVDNECKELLFEISDSIESQNIIVKSINLKSDNTHQYFEFDWAQEAHMPVSLSPPLRYIYEPNAAILKSGAFKSIAHSLNISKIAPHSHLYTSSELVLDFPGRSFALETILKADLKTLREHLPTLKANLTLRNFPATTDELRKKLKLKDGGDVYLLATTLLNGDKRLLKCRKV
ncbi:MAG: class I SAM-dependent methyltransferase [Runella zeae]